MSVRLGKRTVLRDALGLRYLGVLLIGSLIIIPAATAKRLSSNLTEMLTFAAVAALVATLIGSGVARWLHREAGPLIVTFAAGGFLLTFSRPAPEPTAWR